jgi:hypothetical protein
MKTQEEIELMADEFTTRDYSHYYYRGKDAYIKAYTKCQEDMFDSLLANTLRRLYDDKKYTEKDIIDAVLFGMQKGLNVGKVDETDNDWVNNYVKSIK